MSVALKNVAGEKKERHPLECYLSLKEKKSSDF
jgi:hypothetical protein